MSGITSGVGIFSGINSAQLIEQLLSIEARPKNLAQQRLLNLQGQRSAFLDVNSALLGLRTAAAGFNSKKVFQASRATSSNTSVLTATAGVNAAEGSYNLTVTRLVSTAQKVSRGFADKDTSGVGATSFTFEVGGGRLDSETLLSELNGGEGVERGRLRITDSDDNTTVIDLTRAVTVNDVLNAINGASGINVTAAITDQGIEITDGAGGGSNLVIENVFGSTTATSLGVAGTTAAGGTITSGNLLFLTGGSSLERLNDRNGVQIGDGSADFQIVDRNGTVHNIDLGQVVDTEGEVTVTRAATLQEVIDRIEDQTGGAVTAAINGQGTGLTLTDTTGGGSNLIVRATSSGRTTAADLGILTDAAGVASSTLNGERLLAGVNSTLASNLNGGAGVSAGNFDVTRRDGSTFNVVINGGESVAQIIRAINDASGGNVTASLNDAGNGIRITDSTTGGDLIIADVAGTAAADLCIATPGETDGVVESGNLQTRWISAATRLSTLNAGQGIGIGRFRITDSAGQTSVINVTQDNFRTLGELITFINTRPVDVTARINDNGDGIIIEDNAGGASALTIADEDGRVARNLNIAGTAEWEDGDPDEENVINGSYERVVEFSATDTLEEISEAINSAGVGVDAASINAGAGPSPFRLSLTSETSGRIGRFIVDTGDFNLGLSTLSRGDDAVAFFGSGDNSGGIALTSSTNTLDNVIAGVTIDLLTTSEDPVEINVQRDVSAAETAINDFIEAFNNVFDRIDFHERFDQESGERGLLLGDSTLANIRRSLLRTVQGRPQGVQSQFFGLFQAGVGIGEGSRLEFDRDRFREALEQDPQGIADLFAAFRLDPITPEVILEDDDGTPLFTPPPSERPGSRRGGMGA
ncbi:MAG: flagellar filament capping protein FliD, partial [Planctomycetota bacterium]|nr:flagellar filament capping protein FliD [Planctomycetota bacterium]